MARMTSSSSSSPVLTVSNLAPMSGCSYNTRKTSPSSTDTACSLQDDDIDQQPQPLELTSHACQTATCSGGGSSTTVSTSTLCSFNTAQSRPPQFTLSANSLRWTGHRYEICHPPAAAPNSVLFSAYCDSTALIQTGTSTSSHSNSRL